ncbi:MAG: Gfo/Idh/MocA family oxidoreductase [Chloroflexi bacterium]|nr:Gfo/Idh/MocA family oxidoreductase [Chloroflexota bacterium]
MPDKVRIGLIGAGNFTTNRLLPGFQKLPNVEVTVVANRRRESSERVAAQFEIPEVADDFRAVIDNKNVDAVVIGTPPYLHEEAALAALDAGKHVICQTRISTSAVEARNMAEKADQVKPRGIHAMLIPPAPFYRGSRFVKHLIDSGYLGNLHHVLGFNMSAAFADPKAPLSGGRNDLELYGPFNAMQLGLSYDVMSRWTGHATSVVSQRAQFVAERPVTAGGPIATNYYPDEVTVIAETSGGAIAMNLVNYSVLFGDTHIELYGDQGTVVYRSRGDNIMAAQVGAEGLQPMPIPAEYDQPWAIEDEFVRMIRGEIDQPSFTFWDGVKNMEYLEAAYHSAIDGRRVDLPTG